jgi:LysM repeat protein
LAREANNHFGVKCHAGWTGQKIYHDDDQKGECFRVYVTPEESFRDHSDFLAQRERYAFLFQLDPTNYKEWCRGLKTAGYATARNYDNLLIKIIETHQLYLYDKGVTKDPLLAAKKETKTEKEKKPEAEKKQQTPQKTYYPEATVVDLHGLKGGQINRIDYIVAQKGDTWQNLTKKHNKMPWEFYRYNDISREMSAEIVPGQVIYLQPKRRKADREFRFHTVAEGESMWSISQKYGIRLKRLYKMNRMTSEQVVEAGQKIYLRKTKPAIKN